MALGGAIAIGPRQGGFHRSIVLAEPLGKTLQLPPGAGKDPFEPGLQTLRGPLAHHLRKGLRVGGQRREEWTGLLDLEQLGLLGLGPFVRTAEQAGGRLAGPHRRGPRDPPRHPTSRPPSPPPLPPPPTH